MGMLSINTNRVLETELIPIKETVASVQINLPITHMDAVLSFHELLKVKYEGLYYESTTLWTNSLEVKCHSYIRIPKLQNLIGPLVSN